MNRSVRLPERLVRAARIEGGRGKRSVSQQIEYWAELGRAIAPLLSPRRRPPRPDAAVRPLGDCVAEPGTSAGRRRLNAYLRARPFPHYEAAPGRPGLLVRIGADGRRVRGRFVGRRFRPERKAR